MNKSIAFLSTAVFLSACVDNPNSPFYDPGELMIPVVEGQPLILPDIPVAPVTDENGAVVSDAVVDTAAGNVVAVTDEQAANAFPLPKEEVVAQPAPAPAGQGQCLTSDVLANVTFSVVPKGTKGVEEKSGGKEFFISGGKRYDFTNVPYSLTSC